MKKIALALCLMFLTSLSATELAPWYPRDLELQPKAEFAYQTYSTLNTPHGNKHHCADNYFLNLSLSGAYDLYAAEIEINFADTSHRVFTLSDVRLTGRYQIYDDVIGDPFSLVAGVTIIQDLRLARQDVNCFYHGGIEAEFTLAAGKEVVCGPFWYSRVWGVFGFGIADMGSPWLRFDAHWDHNWCDASELSLFMYTLWGLGGEGLSLNTPFRGYGPIHHQSVDLGIKYSKTFYCGDIASIGYAFRPYALNCPRFVSTFFISYLYPFGL